MWASMNPTINPEYTAAERKEDFVREITLYVGNHRLEAALAREELAQLEGAQRHFALSKNLILGAAIISRKWGREGCKLAVFILISMLSDNAKGACLLSQARMAQILGRQVRRISEAIDEMEMADLISVERTDKGLPRAYWPNVPRAIADMSPATTWFVDALSDAPPPRGRPRLVPKYPAADDGFFLLRDGETKKPGRKRQQDITTEQTDVNHAVRTPTSNSSKGTLDGGGRS
jgi:hypothetical protein